MIDLHTHTSASDGTDTPTQLIRKAKEAGIQAIAITDHDTLKGLDEAQEAGDKYGVEIIRGIEISSKCEQGLLHIIGLFLPKECIKLENILQDLNGNRINRMRNFVQKINDLCDFEISYERVMEIANGATIGRPHLATALVEKDVVKTTDQAFDEYLSEDCPTFVQSKNLDIKETIELLKESGAIVTLAHPFASSYKTINKEWLFAQLPLFKSYGLDGIGAYHTEHTKEQTEFIKAQADKNGLLVDGGSDYHGTLHPRIRLGYTSQNQTMDYSILQKLKQSHAKLSH